MAPCVWPSDRFCSENNLGLVCSSEYGEGKITHVGESSNDLQGDRRNARGPRQVMSNHFEKSLETRGLTAEIASKDLNFHLPQENFNVLLEESNLLHCVITGNKWAYVLNIRTRASSSGHCFKGQPRPKMAKPRSLEKLLLSIAGELRIIKFGVIGKKH